MIISMNDYYYVWLLENCMCVRVPGIFQRILWDQHCEAYGWADGYEQASSCSA